jgi:hypothetical protein
MIWFSCTKSKFTQLAQEGHRTLKRSLFGNTVLYGHNSVNLQNKNRIFKTRFLTEANNRTYTIMENYLKDTYFLDFNNEAYDSFLEGVKLDEDPSIRAVQLYNKVRDHFLYDPYHLNLTQEGLRTSQLLHKKRAWCVEKAAILAALARKCGIPSRLGYAVVTNHIGVEKLVEYLRREEIVFHGYTEMNLNGQWIKCTPAFDKRICRISKVEPLEWDGKSDSLFQEFASGKRFMEYLHFYGVFPDIPLELMNMEMKRYYPHLFQGEYNSKEFSFIPMD